LCNISPGEGGKKRDNGEKTNKVWSSEEKGGPWGNNKGTGWGKGGEIRNTRSGVQEESGGAVKKRWGGGKGGGGRMVAIIKMMLNMIGNAGKAVKQTEGVGHDEKARRGGQKEKSRVENGGGLPEATRGLGFLNCCQKNNTSLKEAKKNKGAEQN